MTLDALTKGNFFHQWHRSESACPLKDVAADKRALVAVEAVRPAIADTIEPHRSA
jgi:hypothetical protein